MSEETSVLAQAGHRIEGQDRIILDQAAEIASLRDALESMPDCKLLFRKKADMEAWDDWTAKVYRENKTIWRAGR